MESEILVTGRDAALILLLVEWIVISLVPLAALFFITRSLRRFLPQVPPALRNVAQIADTIRQKTELVCQKIAAPFIWSLSAAQGIRRGLALIRGRR